MLLKLSKGKGSAVFHGHRVSVLPDEKVLEMDVVKGCIIMQVYLININGHLKWLRK
jgi:hypothetical protein